VIEESGAALASLGTTRALERGCSVWKTVSAVSADVVDNAVGFGEGAELAGGAGVVVGGGSIRGSPAMARSLVEGENGGLEELLVTDIAFIGEMVLMPPVVVVHRVLASLSNSADVANEVPSRILFVYIWHGDAA
jgi:hypothetical protein